MEVSAPRERDGRGPHVRGGAVTAPFPTRRGIIDLQEQHDQIKYMEEMLAKKITKEEALSFLQRAGILGKDGKLTEPYRPV